MAILSFCGKRYTVDHAVQGVDYIHGYDADGLMVVSFEGVKDFSLFAYDGEFMNPETCEAEGCNETILLNGSLITKDGREVTAEDVGAVNTDDFIDWFGLPITIPANADISTYITPGKYYCTEANSKTLTNSPIGNDAFILYVTPRSAKSVGQLAFGYAGSIYFRMATTSGTFSKDWAVFPRKTQVLLATESTNYPGCFYRTVDDVTEWYNPPMSPNKEYRTIERYNGKIVYTAAIECGELPNNDVKQISLSGKISNSSGITQYIGSPVILLPDKSTFTGVGFDASKQGPGAHIWAYAFAARIDIRTDYDGSGTEVTAIIKYTRD